MVILHVKGSVRWINIIICVTNVLMSFRLEILLSSVWQISKYDEITPNFTHSQKWYFSSITRKRKNYFYSIHFKQRFDLITTHFTSIINYNLYFGIIPKVVNLIARLSAYFTEWKTNKVRSFIWGKERIRFTFSALFLTQSGEMW